MCYGDDDDGIGICAGCVVVISLFTIIGCCCCWITVFVGIIIFDRLLLLYCILLYCASGIWIGTWIGIGIDTGMSAGVSCPVIMVADSYPGYYILFNYLNGWCLLLPFKWLLLFIVFIGCCGCIGCIIYLLLLLLILLLLLLGYSCTWLFHLCCWLWLWYICP